MDLMMMIGGMLAMALGGMLLDGVSNDDGSDHGDDTGDSSQSDAPMSLAMLQDSSESSPETDDAPSGADGDPAAGDAVQQLDLTAAAQPADAGSAGPAEDAQEQPEAGVEDHAADAGHEAAAGDGSGTAPAAANAVGPAPDAAPPDVAADPTAPSADAVEQLPDDFALSDATPATDGVAAGDAATPAGQGISPAFDVHAADPGLDDPPADEAVATDPTASDPLLAALASAAGRTDGVDGQDITAAAADSGDSGGEAEHADADLSVADRRPWRDGAAGDRSGRRRCGTAG